MGTDISKITYSDSYRPGAAFADWIIDTLGGGASCIRYVPDEPEDIEYLRKYCPEIFRERLERLLRDYGGHDIAVG